MDMNTTTPSATQNLYTSFRAEANRIADLDKAKALETAVVEADETQLDKYGGQEGRSLVESLDVDGVTIRRGTYDQFSGLERTVSVSLENSERITAEQTAKTDSNWDRIRRRTETDYTFQSNIVGGENGAKFGRPKATLEVSVIHNQLQTLDYKGLRKSDSGSFPVAYYLNDGTERERLFEMRVDYSPGDNNLGAPERLAQTEYKRLSELKDNIKREMMTMPRSFSSNDDSKISTPESGEVRFSSWGFPSSSMGEEPLGFVGSSDSHQYNYRHDTANGVETFSIADSESGVREFIERRKTKDGVFVESYGYESPERPVLED